MINIFFYFLYVTGATLNLFIERQEDYGFAVEEATQNEHNFINGKH